MDIRARRGYLLPFSPVAHKLLIQRHRGRVTKEKPVDRPRTTVLSSKHENLPNDHQRSCYVISCQRARSPIKSSIFTVNTRRPRERERGREKKGTKRSPVRPWSRVSLEIARYGLMLQKGRRWKGASVGRRQSGHSAQAIRKARALFSSLYLQLSRLVSATPDILCT